MAAWLFFNTYSILADSIAFKQIEAGIARLLAGQQPPTASLGLNTLYLIPDSIMVLISVIVLWPLLRLPHWYRKYARRPEHRMRRIILPLIRELIFPVLLLFLTLVLLGAIWALLIAFQSDISYWYLAILALLLITGIIRVMLAFLVLRWQRQEAGRQIVAPSAS